MTLYVKQLEQALTSLLNDEDVKSLPCYKLLFNKYGSIIQPPPTKKMVKCECGMLFKSDTHFTSEKHLAFIRAEAEAKRIKEKDQTEDDAQRLIEEAEEQQLIKEAEAYEEQQRLKEEQWRTKLSSEEDKNPTTEESPNKPVYQVEIKGTIYLNKDDILYDSKTYKKVGSIGKSGFIIGTKIIPIKTQKKLELHPDLDNNKWIDNEQIVYSKVNQYIAHQIGLLDNDELQLWD
jgi:hypothetical protein